MLLGFRFFYLTDLCLGVWESYKSPFSHYEDPGSNTVQSMLDLQSKSVVEVEISARAGLFFCLNHSKSAPSLYYMNIPTTIFAIDSVVKYKNPSSTPKVFLRRGHCSALCI